MVTGDGIGVRSAGTTTVLSDVHRQTGHWLRDDTRGVGVLGHVTSGGILVQTVGLVVVGKGSSAVLCGLCWLLVGLVMGVLVAAKDSALVVLVVVSGIVVLVMMSGIVTLVMSGISSGVILLVVVKKTAKKTTLLLLLVMSSVMMLLVMSGIMVLVLMSRLVVGIPNGIVLLVVVEDAP
jgi:hypothetical protein